MKTFPSDTTGRWLERALDLGAGRHRLISSNIQNVDTPGFIPSDLSFSDHLRHAARSGRLDDTLAPRTRRVTDVEPDLDGNRVDLDREVVHLTSNRLFLELATEVVGRRFNLMRYAIDEGGR